MNSDLPGWVGGGGGDAAGTAQAEHGRGRVDAGVAGQGAGPSRPPGTPLAT